MTFWKWINFGNPKLPNFARLTPNSSPQWFTGDKLGTILIHGPNWPKFLGVRLLQLVKAQKYLVENNLFPGKRHSRVLLSIEFVWSNWPLSPINVLMSQIKSAVDQFWWQNFFSAWFFQKHENKLKSDFTRLTPWYLVTKSEILGSQVLVLRKW